jgi:flagellin
MKLGANTSSLRAQTNLSLTTSKLASTFERLSSGLRITKPADDAAGLAIADSLKADARIASVAIRNANDGVSIISITDSALDSIASILTRMAELASQSANGTYSSSQRSALAAEFLALSSEVDRIAASTEFNDIKLLSNSQAITLQVGLNGANNSQIQIQSIVGTLAGIGLATGGTLTYSIQASTNDASISAARNAVDAVSSAISQVSLLRGIVGSAESRLSVAISNLQVARENFVAAESRIRDVDVASEAAELVRLQILQQAGTAVLAQANMQPELVLKLLGSGS